MAFHDESTKRVAHSNGLKAALVVLAVTAGGLVALVGAHAQGTDEGAKGGKRGAELQQRFKAADANNVGKLSKEEARAGMPMVYKHFDEIDTAKTGTVSLADIAAFAKAHHQKKAE